MTNPPNDPAGYGSGGVHDVGDLPRIPEPEITKQYVEESMGKTSQAREDEIRAAFVTEDGSDGWMWTSFAQYSPDGTVIGQLGFLICPICKAMVANPPEDVEPGSRLDWPQGHIEDHVRRGG